MCLKDVNYWEEIRKKNIRMNKVKEWVSKWDYYNEKTFQFSLWLWGHMERNNVFAPIGKGCHVFIFLGHLSNANCQNLQWDHQYVTCSMCLTDKPANSWIIHMFIFLIVVCISNNCLTKDIS